MQILLSQCQAGPGRTVEKEQEEISRNHVPSSSLLADLCKSFVHLSVCNHHHQEARRADRRGRGRLHPGARPQRSGPHDGLRGGLRDGALLGRERRRGAKGALRFQGRRESVTDQYQGGPIWSRNLLVRS